MSYPYASHIKVLECFVPSSAPWLYKLGLGNNLDLISGFDLVSDHELGSDHGSVNDLDLGTNFDSKWLKADFDLRTDLDL